MTEKETLVKTDSTQQKQTEKTVIIGIGNPLLKDDRAGIEVAERIEKMDLDLGVEILHTVGFEVLDKVLGFDRAVVVDACQLGHAPGTVLNLELADIAADHALMGSHASTLLGTLKAGHTVFPDMMPQRINIMLIEVENAMEFGPKCTPLVEKAVEQVVELISRRYSQPGNPTSR
jgi:hydrogenase maturation protease